jgi:hypothetical protein
MIDLENLSVQNLYVESKMNGHTLNTVFTKENKRKFKKIN